MAYQIPELHDSGYFSAIYDCIMLSPNAIKNWGAKPFCCIDVWLNNVSLRWLVASKWNKMANLPVHHKLKHTKSRLEIWSREKFGNIDKIIDLFLKEL